MNKLLKIIIFLIFSLLFVPSSVVRAEDVIRYDVINGDTLVVSGTGEACPVADFEKIEKKIKKIRIKKLIISEGITSISSSLPHDMRRIERIELPDTLVEIGDYAFSCNEYLKEVRFGKNLKKVGEDAFVGCENLRQVVLPDSVSEIGLMAFSGCSRLKKLVLPASLSSWDVLVVNDCPALREVVNNSRLSCKIPGYKKYVTWKVGKKETRVIPPGKTGKVIGKTIPIQFDLMKGRAVGKLPKSYRFGEEVKLPDCVKRDGYVFMGWSTSMYDSVTKVEPGQKKAKFYATWYKYKVESKKRGTVTVTFDSTEAALIFWDHAIRYSMHKNMKEREIVYCDKKKGKVTIWNLWPGRTYYFQICGVPDGDMPYTNWKAKRKVSICI